MQAMRVLVVDDERSVRDSLGRALRIDGYDVELVATGMEAVTAVATNTIDVVVLDVQMPGLDGLDTCRLLRARGEELPVLMLTARTSVTDRVAGLDAGADDYLAKPFALDELRARLRALTRRHKSDATAASETLHFADLMLDPVTREVTRNDRPLVLTRLEFSLLELMMSHPKQVLTREIIFERVWGYDFGANSNSLEVYIGYLRRKTEEGGEPRLIETVRGVGYVLRETVP